MTAMPPITMLGASIRWRALVRSARALTIFLLGRFAMGSVEVADAEPALPGQFVVASASFVFRRWPAMQFAEQVHQRQGSIDGRGHLRSCLATFFALSLFSRLPPRHPTAQVFRVHWITISDRSRRVGFAR